MGIKMQRNKQRKSERKHRLSGPKWKGRGVSTNIKRAPKYSRSEKLLKINANIQNRPPLNGEDRGVWQRIDSPLRTSFQLKVY